MYRRDKAGKSADKLTSPDRLTEFSTRPRLAPGPTSAFSTAVEARRRLVTRTAMIYAVPSKESTMLPLVLAAVLAAAVAGSAWAAEPSIEDCDRLAAHREDGERVRTGVSFTELDAERAIAACEAAVVAEPRRARLRYQYARALHKAGNFQQALKQYREAAAQDYAAAQYALGLILGDSKVVLRNQMKAVRWYRKAAQAGHAGAGFRLGLMYRAGRGVPQDDAEALRWFGAAAAQGLARAQFIIGRMYDEGLGIPENDTEAVAWYRKAAAQGHGRARFALAALRPDTIAALNPDRLAAEATTPSETLERPQLMTPTTDRSELTTPQPTPLPQPTAANSLPAPAKTGTATDTPRVATVTAHSIADALERGLAAYRAGDYQAAFDAWFPLAKSGVRRAEFHIGGLFLEGRGVESDKVQAYYWLKRADMQNYPAAQPLLIQLTRGMNADEMRRAKELIAARHPDS